MYNRVKFLPNTLIKELRVNIFINNVLKYERLCFISTWLPTHTHSHTHTHTHTHTETDTYTHTQTLISPISPLATKSKSNGAKGSPCLNPHDTHRSS